MSEKKMSISEIREAMVKHFPSLNGQKIEIVGNDLFCNGQIIARWNEGDSLIIHFDHPVWKNWVTEIIVNSRRGDPKVPVLVKDLNSHIVPTIL